MHLCLSVRRHRNDRPRCSDGRRDPRDRREVSRRAISRDGAHGHLLLAMQLSDLDHTRSLAKTGSRRGYNWLENVTKSGRFLSFFPFPRMQGGAAGRDYPVEHLLDDIALINPCYWTVYMYLLLLRITLATKISALKERKVSLEPAPRVKQFAPAFGSLLYVCLTCVPPRIRRSHRRYVFSAAISAGMSGEMPQDKFDYTCQNFWPKIMESSFNWMASQSVTFRSLPYIYDAFPINLSK